MSVKLGENFLLLRLHVDADADVNDKFVCAYGVCVDLERRTVFAGKAKVCNLQHTSVVQQKVRRLQIACRTHGWTGGYTSDHEKGIGIQASVAR